MASIQQAGLYTIVPGSEIHICSDQVLPGSLLVRGPLLSVFLPNMVPHHVVEVAVRFGSSCKCGRRRPICRDIVLDIVEQSFYGRIISFDALLGCASE